MENLISVLEQESMAYEELLALSMKKTPIIVSGDLEGLQQITDEEQIVVAKINHLDANREEVTKDIANVLNKDVKSLKLVDIIHMLSQRPVEQNQLATAHDKLKGVIGQMKRVNEQNQELIKQSLEMVEFDLNLIHAMKSAPQTANYTKGAYNTGAIMGRSRGGFDAKQ
ncbi:MAG: flagellar protein FlgN [Lachnospiraceae bacterium]|nr:flagellar protein FlgN [Lachnospiraceae bacterium]